MSAPTLARLPPLRELAARLEEALSAYENEPDGMPLMAGLGVPRKGRTGLGESIVHARRASVRMPSARSTPHIRLGSTRAVDRVLALWDSDQVLRHESATLVSAPYEPKSVKALRAKSVRQASGRSAK